MVTVFTSVGWAFLRATERLPDYAVQLVALVVPRFSSSFIATVPFFDFVGWILRVLLFKSTFSIQLLCTLALQMAKFLEREQLDDAREQLSWLCSRSPSNMSADELAGATLESLSENLSDGFVAPMFWYCLLGPLGSVAYRVANALDSRIGYRGKYEFLGKASARFDDVLNLVPARLTCVFLALAATFVTDCSGSDGIKTAISDRKQCDSPNAGWPMASMAGLLGVRLEKKGEYCLGAGHLQIYQRSKRDAKYSNLEVALRL
jgi:adenosylcobinamide-phosphate synthase